MKIADIPLSPLLTKEKGIIIRGMEKPNCCFDCPFLTKPETIHQFFEVEGKRKQYFKHVYNCTLIPEDEEDGWHDLEWVMENIQPWCPISEFLSIPLHPQQPTSSSYLSTGRNLEIPERRDET